MNLIRKFCESLRSSGDLGFRNVSVTLRSLYASKISIVSLALFFVTGCTPYLVGTDDLSLLIRTIPRVVSVGTTTVSGTYKSGTVIPVKVTFTENVVVTGVPQLELNVTPQTLVGYASGSGSKSITFSYVVGSTDAVSPAVDYASVNALILNGAKIQSLLGVDADLQLPAPSSGESLFGGMNNPVILLDTELPAAPTNVRWGSGAVTIQASASMTLNWSKFIELDLISQRVKVFENGTCAGSSTTNVDLNAALQTLNVTGENSKTYSAKVVAIDLAGNESESVCSGPLTVDTSAPTISISSPVAGFWINSATNTSFTVSGTCSESGRMVSIRSGVTTFGTATCTGVLFSGTVDASAMAVGLHSLVASISDTAGNTANAAVSIGKDIVAPVLVISSPAAGAWINLANQSNFGVSGTCSDTTSGVVGRTVHVSMTDGATTLTGTGTCVADGTFSATINASTLANTPSGSAGNISITATVSDIAGNSFTSAATVVKKDAVAPVITITNPLTNTFVKGNVSLPVNLKLTELNANSSQTFSIIYSNGSSTTNSAVQVADGPLTNAEFSKSIMTPNSSNTSISITINYADLAGNPASTASANYTTDLGVPTVTSLTLNGGTVDTTNNNVTVSLSATNGLSPVTQFCLKYNNTTAPTASDPCWVNVNDPSPNIQPSTAISFSNYYFQVGFVQATYTVYAWAKNQAGGISSLSGAGGIGSLNVDKFTVNYNPGSPPTITKLKVTNTNNPSTPVATNELQVASGQNIFVKWKASDQEGLKTNPISIYYTEDNVNYTPFSGASALPNDQGSGCMKEAADEGCAVLTAPTSSYFKVRLVATDTRNTTVFYNSEPLNNSKLRIIAGNTETGLGGSAKTAIFNSLGQASTVSYVYRHRLAVSSDGKYFYIDPSYGLVWINPATGILSVFIPKAANYTTDNADGSSDVSTATLKNPYGIAIDYYDNLLIYDFDRIRKVNLSTMKISTMIGGGNTELSTMTSTVNALSQVKLTSYIYSNLTLTMIPMPDGNLLFTSPKSDESGLTDWKYVSSSGQLEPMTYFDDDNAGMGNEPSYSWSTERKIAFAIEFDPSSSVVTSMLKGFYKTFTGDSWPMYASINFSSGTVASGYPATENYNLGFTLDEAHLPSDKRYGLNTRSVTTGLDGKIYVATRYRTTLEKYDSSTNNKVLKLGTGGIPNEPCPENTLATDCAVDIESFFVSRAGRVYFIDQGTLRTINDSNQVITLFGQFPSYNGIDGSGSIAAANARFGRIMDLKLDRSLGANHNRMVVLDSYSGNYREVMRNGSVSKLSSIYYSWHGPYKFELEPSTGDIFSPVDGLSLRRFNKNSGQWTTVVGFGGTPYYDGGDGKTGTNINLVSGYNISIVGLVNSHLFYNKRVWADANYQCMVKKYNISTNYTQSHFLGNSTCDNQWLDGGSTSATGTSISTNVSRVELYQPDNKYLIMRDGGYLYSIDATSGTPLNYITRLPGGNTYSFTHVVDTSSGSNVLQIYYCTGGDRIHRYTPSTGLHEELQLGVPRLVCSSQATLNYIQSTNSIIFSHAENGLYGVAEYDLDSVP